MEMKRIKRASVVLIAVALVISLTMVIPASAQSGEGSVDVLSSEFVLATMASTGEIEEVQIFNQLSLDGKGNVTVREEKAFDDVGGFQGVKGFTKPSVEGDYIVWPEISVNGPQNVLATTVLSESMVEEARTRIPLDVRFKYWFDGEPVTDLNTVTGKSGRFKMELTLTNESKEKTEIEYKDPTTGTMVTEEVETYLPMVVLPYDWYFDNQVFFNLEADPTGLIVPMPDFYNVGWSIPLFPPATEESHTIWVAGDVKDFQMPPLTLAVAFHFPESNQTNITATLAPYIKAFYEGMVTVNQGIGSPEADPSLLFGITAVDNGLQQLAAGLPEAKTNLDAKIIPGVTQAAAGIGSATTPDTLLYADTAAISGLQGIKAGIGSTTTDATLLYAANALVTNLQTISAGLGDATQPTSIIGGIYGIMIGLGTDPSSPGILQGLQQMKAGLDAPFPDGVISGLQYMHDNIGPAATAGTLLNQIDGLIATMTVDNWPSATPTLRAYVNNSVAINGGVIDGTANATLLNYLNTIGAQLTAGRPNIQLMYDSLGDASDESTIIGGLTYMSAGMGTMIAGLQQMVAGLPLIYGGLVTIQNGIGSVTTADTLLYAAAAIESGLNTIKGGIGDVAIDGTLLYALAAIQNGLTQIKAGLSSGDMSNPAIKEGLVLISAGIGDAVTGLGSSGTPDTLLYGSNAVREGLTELGGGTTQLEEGLGAVLTNFSMTDSELKAIAHRGEEFDHFLGRAQDADNQVRFVYQSKPTYNYKTGSSSSWIVAIVLSIIIALALVAGGILLARRSTA